MAKTVIIYWSGTGNTEAMANAIAEGVQEVDSDVTVLSVSEASEDDVISAEKVLLGCPSMGVEELEEYEFKPFYDAIKDQLFGKPVGLFGSYDWGNGEWMEAWETELNELGADLFAESLIHHLSIDGEEDKARQFGKNFASQ